jgi:transposase
MPKKIYQIKLNDEEGLQLLHYVRAGNKSARAINRARILLLADCRMSDEEICGTLGVGMATVYRVRKGFHAGGVEAALPERPRSGAPSKIDGRAEATLLLLACADPPEGQARWTLP